MTDLVSTYNHEYIQRLVNKRIKMGHGTSLTSVQNEIIIEHSKKLIPERNIACHIGKNKHKLTNLCGLKLNRDPNNKSGCGKKCPK